MNDASKSASNKIPLMKRYANSKPLKKIQSSVPVKSTFMNNQPAKGKPAPAAPAKPKLVVEGRNAYWQNGDGTRTPYKKNFVDKAVDRVLGPY